MLAQRQDWRSVVVLLLVVPVIAAGCSSVRNRDTVSPYCFPNGMYGGPRSEQVPINLIRLRQDPPPVYILAPGDTLGIYIEGVLGNREEPPPIHFPEKEMRDMPPAIGYPIPLREDGTLPLPLIPPIRAEGLTIAQLESVIRKAYVTDSQILAPGRDRIIVTLMRTRKYKVIVVREDMVDPRRMREQGEGEVTIGSERTGAAHLVELPAYENDVLHALTQSGGLPGLNAKNEIVILRGTFDYATDVKPLLEELPQFLDPNDPRATRDKNVIRIPLRAAPGKPLQKLEQDEIILNDGDIVFIQSRDAEVFYTGGLLQGGQHAIPRDFDLDIFGAMAMAGGSVAAAAGGVNLDGGGAGVGTIFPPTRLLVLRMENGQQHTIRIDLKRALSDPAQRILIKPDDFLVLEYTPWETVMNTILSTVRFNVAVDSLFN